jgi:L-iditol 2-dehydrogenase
MRIGDEFMKAFAAFESEKTGIIDLPVPDPKEDEVLVKMEACVICNTTDWMVIRNHFGAPAFPIAIGHESIGRVVQAGSKVRNLKIGDRVTRANAIPTGFNGSYYSAWGGFAEFGIAKDKPVVQGLNELPLEKAGLLVSLSETASCLMQLESIQDKDVLVTGTGIAGLSLVYFAKKFGARKVLCTGRRPERLEIAKKLGADMVFLANSDEIMQAAHDGLDVDYVFEATGKYDVFEAGIPLLKENGTLALYGVPDRPYVLNENKSPINYRNFRLSLNEEMAYPYVCGLLREDDKLSGMLMTHQWRFENIQDAFQQVKLGQVIKGMIVMT